MGLSADDLTVIDTVLSAQDAGAQAFAQLRQRFPKISWTRCDASDVVETPFRVYPGFEVHLVDTADHCVQLTSDPTRATGVVLAKRSPTP
jgi:hypothetical protein